MNVLIVGATGFIGSHLAKACLEEKWQLTVSARNSKKLNPELSGLNFIQSDYSSIENTDFWLPHLRDIDVVINAVGVIAETGSQKFEKLHHQGPSILFKACEMAGVKKVIQISAIGAEESAFSAYHKSKHKADECLKQLDITSVIVKPSVVYGEGGSSSAFFQAISALPVHVLIGKGEQVLQPIFVEDLAMAIINLIKNNEDSNQELEAVGPKVVTYKEMLENYRHQLGLGKLRPIYIPSALIQMAGKIAGALGSGMLNSDNVNMLLEGNSGNTKGITQCLERPPLAMKTVLDNNPPIAAEFLSARLFFLLPVLRVSVAFVWIFSGLTSAFFYPVSASYELLASIGLTDLTASLSLYGAALIDIVFGLAVLFRFHTYLFGIAQLALISVYTMILTFYLPEFWIDPFGPLIKNFPMMAAIMILMAVEK